MIVKKCNNYYFNRLVRIKDESIDSCACFIAHYAIKVCVQNSYFHNWDLIDLISSFKAHFNKEIDKLRVAYENGVLCEEPTHE